MRKCSLFPSSIDTCSIARLLVLAAACLPMRAYSEPPADSQVKPLTVSGAVVADRQSTLSCRMPARIVGVFARENESLKKGEALVQLDDKELRLQLASARAALAGAMAQELKASAGRAAQAAKSESDSAAARNGLADARHKRDQAALARDAASSESAADIKLAEETVQKASIALIHARKTLRDLETLDAVGGVSRNDLEEARTQVTLAQVDLDGAAAGVRRLTQGPEGVPYRVAMARKDLEAAQQGVVQAEEAAKITTDAAKKTLSVADQEVRSSHSAVLQARTGVASAADAVAAMRLVSPFDGIVSAVNARTGETAQPGVPLVTIVSLKNLRVEALVLARNIPGISVGTRASVSVDTQPGRSLDAVVSEISRVAESDQRSIRVKLRLLKAGTLRPGLAARVSFHR